MSKFLKIFVPSLGGATGMLTMAYVLADQFVVDMPAPVRNVFIGPAEAQTAADQTIDAPTTQDAPASGAEPAAASDPVVPSAAGGYGLGREALPEEIAAWDIDVRPDGLGLPEGRGDVDTGEDIFVDYCASCHGDFGEAVGRWPVLAGGRNTLTDADPVKTIGSFWPYLSTVYDYVNRAMPFGNAQSLTPDEIYAITAYLLYVNDLVEDDFELSHENFVDVRLPNEPNFFDDDRATTELNLFSAEPCMENCKETVEITMHASILDVTPQSADDEPATEATGDVIEEPAAVDAAVPEADATATIETATEESEAEVAALDPALVAEGENVFRACRACHQVGEDAVNRTGPVLNGIVGQVAGTVEGFRYSSVMADAGAAGLIWTPETLAEFLANPRSYMPGTKMSYAGMRDPADIAAINAYLQSFGD